MIHREPLSPWPARVANGSDVVMIIHIADLVVHMKAAATKYFCGCTRSRQPSLSPIRASSIGRSWALPPSSGTSTSATFPTSRTDPVRKDG